MHHIVRAIAALVFGAAMFLVTSATLNRTPSRAPAPALTSTPSPPSPTRPANACPNVCTMIYQPVRCLFENGTSLAFGNICQAQAYACDRRLRIIACVPRSINSAAPQAV